MEDNKNKLIPVTNSLISIERQISIGEKVLGITLSEFEKDKIKKLLIKVLNENYDILSIICQYFTLTEKTIEQYKDKLNWSSLCKNENLGCNESFIDKYENYIDWEGLSSNSSIKWNEDLIAKYYSYVNLDSIIENKTFEFNYQLYLKYKDKISFDTLNYIKIDLPKEFVKKNKEVLEWNNFFPLTFENFEYFAEEIDWVSISRSKHIELNDSIIKKYSDFWKWDEVVRVENSKNEIIYFRIFKTKYSDGVYTNLIFNEDSYIDDVALSQIKNRNVWVHLSRDLKNIDEFIIEKYSNYWEWELLTTNNNVSWTFELVEKFKDKISWRIFSLNPNVIWSDLFIKSFENYINWDYIGLNTKLPWNIDFYLKYKNKINPKFLFFIENFEINNDEFFKSNRDIGECFVKHHFDVNLDIKLIEYFKENLNWHLISGRYLFEKADIEKYKNYISWDRLSCNRKINWDKELLERYVDNWDWEYLHKNKLVNYEIFNYLLLSKSVEFLKEKNLFQTLNPSIWFRKYFISVINHNDVEMILNEI